MTKKGKALDFLKNHRPVLPSFRVELDGGRGAITLTVSGAVGVKEFSAERVVVACKSDNLDISGEGLKMTVFESKTVEISGKISDISFSRSKGRKQR